MIYHCLILTVINKETENYVLLQEECPPDLTSFKNTDPDLTESPGSGFITLFTSDLVAEPLENNFFSASFRAANTIDKILPLGLSEKTRCMRLAIKKYVICPSKERFSLYSYSLLLSWFSKKERGQINPPPPLDIRAIKTSHQLT